MKRLLPILMLVLALTGAGCTGMTISRGGTRGLLPSIPVPERPVLQELDDAEAAAVSKLQPSLLSKIAANQLELQKLIKKYEVSVTAYNAYAETNNAMARQELGLEAKATAPEEKKPNGH